MSQQAELDAALKELVRLRRAKDDWDWQDTPEDIDKAMLRQPSKKAKRGGAAILTLSKATAEKPTRSLHLCDAYRVVM
jgi:hypothetical protein